ncbi:tRNA (adenosine(37)-N6)-threonylcarbamoyltransferase complex ATPase subunit type 1 TsaE [Atopobacter sp. AH10]|uniref:tRNA (adenosine(37)-N6)-threonylcarbamoyltransferase complex ATPase subunit type 1 TsaE n=1 Tax=Atopobacter sp. AH10 TaxID=2315861 RepID=UPI000EF202F1|nr:tRNA (adenosine(37)-N6)-threonylcarbamoyltransferase complex ATPase subunit type 1 TsaE [Atopobacter sp. AH10]RLK63903.1 tRNA (adenosine(37)-N6)-threonylcarbamoyltransferase complex ATPase subunit type 1 TsaE [Atopobacter sp. AH10]
MWQAKTDEEMRELGKRLGQALTAGDHILLEGDLGVGKTTLTKGIAEALGVTRPLKSPTYTLIREYPEASIPLYHMDMYRITEEEAEILGLEEYYEADAITVIEWPQQIGEWLPDDALTIKVTREEDDTRSLAFSAEGSASQALLHRLEMN